MILPSAAISIIRSFSLEREFKVESISRVIIDQMQSNPETCKRLGLENKSTFHGNEVDKDEKINKKL